jgi:hypothetical protein
MWRFCARLVTAATRLPPRGARVRAALWYSGAAALR